MNKSIRLCPSNWYFFWKKLVNSHTCGWQQNKTENSRKQFNAAMTILCKINELLKWMIKRFKEQMSERGYGTPASTMTWINKRMRIVWIAEMDWYSLYRKRRLSANMLQGWLQRINRKRFQLFALGAVVRFVQRWCTVCFFFQKKSYKGSIARPNCGLPLRVTRL